MKGNLCNLACMLCLIFSGACALKESKGNPEETVRGTDQPVEWLDFRGDDSMPYIVLVSGDEEYRSEEVLPQLAAILSERHGFNCTVLFAQDPAFPGIVDPNYTRNIPGLSHLDSADLMIIFTRFRALPDAQMEHIDNYLLQGKPVIGMRTSTHAFNFPEEIETGYGRYGNYFKSEDAWNGGFGRLVLGEKWIAHHGNHGDQSTRGNRPDDWDTHPVFNGVNPANVWGPTDVYAVRLPMQPSVTPLMLGQTIDRESEEDANDPLLGMRPSDSVLPAAIERTSEEGEEILVDQNDPMMPVVWTKTYQLPGGQSGVSFTSTMGASVDFLSEDLRRMYVNAVYWLLEMPVPASAEVPITGAYDPSGFAFHDDAYWDAKSLSIAEIAAQLK